jgi:hypothetical protein
MTTRKALAALLVCALAAALVAVPGRVPGVLPPAAAAPDLGPGTAKGEKIVYVAGGLSDEDLIIAGAAVVSADPSAVLLIDTPKAARVNQAFLAAYQPKAVVPVGSFGDGGGLEERLGLKAAPPLAWKRGPPAALWKALFPQAERVVVCPTGNRRLLLHSACLATAVRAPLYLLRGDEGETADLKLRLNVWKARTVFSAGAAADDALKGVEGVRVTPLADAAAVAAEAARQLGRGGPVRNIVVANPADTGGDDLGGMSVLAPYIAGPRRAALVLTDEEGSNTKEAVTVALKRPGLARADTLILAANLKAVPVERRPNPIKGKDEFIEMEPLTPSGDEVFSFATGRLFHADSARLAAVLARQKLLPSKGTPRKALVVSNPGGGLPLLETFSRHTANELRNAGYQTTTLFENQAERDVTRKTLPQVDIFLWEGHYRTLTDEFGFLTWDEPLRPSLCFLQSCLALKEEEAQPLLDRGAVAIVGSSTRTYSGTGGAFTVAFFNALAYDNQTLGGALRQAKNFLLAYSLLKEKRLGQNAKLTGVNVRSAWAFTLWGDPTLRLPAPPQPDGALEPIDYEVRTNSLTLTLPDATYKRVTVGDKYEAEMRPNARLAGLLTNGAGENMRRLVPFAFAEVRLPKAPPGEAPRLRGRLPGKNFVFTWDGRRHVGYLLAIPRSQDRDELRFRVEWEE